MTLEEEFAYTRYEDSCRSRYATRECRRQKGHEGDCASGYPLTTWTVYDASLISEVIKSLHWRETGYGVRVTLVPGRGFTALLDPDIPNGATWYNE